MDSFRLNLIAMAFLSVVFVIFGASILSEGLFHSDNPEKQGYAIEVVEAPAKTDSGTPAAKAYEDIAPLLASADLGAGEKVFKKCAACHTAESGGKNKVGPNLFNIVGGPIGGVDGFGYSKALSSYADGKTWNYDELNGFLFKPKKHMKGTAMGFAGLKKTKDRANLIGWLRTKADKPLALPGS